MSTFPKSAKDAVFMVGWREMTYFGMATQDKSPVTRQTG
ncbi:hypothetical protein THTE_4152 [Thermogutta terrifontis]|uniref:Uncharacterized protein n=1 Tax=Thermogutta terrifontis TaxID=1331910 RepID=A0A286RLB9_9BACT|nr:hypothetical protein THTE_4152 [Thermogutta terrifontis]